MPDGTLATWCNTQSRWLHGGYQTRITKKPRYLSNSRVFFVYLGWLMGLEPTTTGITILDSTN